MNPFQRRILPALSVAFAGLVGLAACQPTTGGGVAAPAEPNTTVRPVTTTAPQTTTTAAPAPTTPSRAGWTYYGGDEFNDTAVDAAKWKPYHNTYGDGNKELACLTPENLTEGGGNLTIRSKKQTITCPGQKAREYTSGFVGSRETGTYYPKFARFEMRAKVPHSQGLWPAFWLRHRNGASTAEVDILEYFHSQVPGKSSTTLHLDGKKNVSKKATPFESPAVATPGWHTWAVEIDSATNNAVKFPFFLDDVAIHTYTDTTAAWSSSAPADATWDIALNQAVGGSWVGNPDGTLGYLSDLNRCSISGTAPGGCTTAGINRVNWSNAASSSYVIDYVRVYTRK